MSEQFDLAAFKKRVAGLTDVPMKAELFDLGGKVGLGVQIGDRRMAVASPIAEADPKAMVDALMEWVRQRIEPRAA